MLFVLHLHLSSRDAWTQVQVQHLAHLLSHDLICPCFESEASLITFLAGCSDQTDGQMTMYQSHEVKTVTLFSLGTRLLQRSSFSEEEKGLCMIVVITHFVQYAVGTEGCCSFLHLLKNSISNCRNVMLQTRIHVSWMNKLIHALPGIFTVMNV